MSSTPDEASEQVRQPFFFSTGMVVDSAQGLIEVCEQQPDAAAEHLCSGHFAPWLEYINRNDLAGIAEATAESAGSPVERLAYFVTLCKVAEYFYELQHRRFTFLLVGRTGVGKSSTINSLLGQPIAAVGAVEPVTATVSIYDVDIHGSPCRVVDTPGLCDGKELDNQYAEQIKDAVGREGVDCLWFVTPLPETRVRSDEITAIRTITEALGSGVWENAVLVLTFADYLPTSEAYLERLTTRPQPLLRVIEGAVRLAEPSMDSAGLTNALPSVAVTNDRDQTPDGRHWLGELYLATLQRISRDGVLSFRAATRYRVDTRSKATLPTSSVDGLRPLPPAPLPALVAAEASETVSSNYRSSQPHGPAAEPSVALTTAETTRTDALSSAGPSISTTRKVQSTASNPHKTIEASPMKRYDEIVIAAPSSGPNPRAQAQLQDREESHQPVFISVDQSTHSKVTNVTDNRIIVDREGELQRILSKRQADVKSGITERDDIPPPFKELVNNFIESSAQLIDFVKKGPVGRGVKRLAKTAIKAAIIGGFPIGL